MFQQKSARKDAAFHSARGKRIIKSITWQAKIVKRKKLRAQPHCPAICQGLSWK